MNIYQNYKVSTETIIDSYRELKYKFGMGVTLSVSKDNELLIDIYSNSYTIIKKISNDIIIHIKKTYQIIEDQKYYSMVVIDKKTYQEKESIINKYISEYNNNIEKIMSVMAE